MFTAQDIKWLKAMHITLDDDRVSLCSQDLAEALIAKARGAHNLSEVFEAFNW